jgi:hypothetical protein
VAVLAVVAMVNVNSPVLLGRMVTFIGLGVAVGPAGDTVEITVTLPENPPRLVTVMSEVLDCVWTMDRDVGLAEMLKPNGLLKMVASAMRSGTDRSANVTNATTKIFLNTPNHAEYFCR